MFYSDDWVTVSDGVQYSAHNHLWLCNGKVYDERSARHNGIIGMGKDLRERIKTYNSHEVSAADEVTTEEK